MITERIQGVKKMVVLKYYIVLHNISQKIKEVIVDKIDFQASKKKYNKNEQKKILDIELMNSIMFQHQNEKKRVLNEYINLKKEIKEYCKSLSGTMKLTNKINK